MSIEQVRGTKGDDLLIGSTEDNRFRGVDGADTIIGGGGNDTADYSVDASYGGNLGILADLAKQAIVDGFGTTDTVIGVTGVKGTQFADIIKGDANANWLRGDGGNDILFGREGNDTLTGGDGADIFVFDKKAGDEVITDFDLAAGDRLWLNSGTKIANVRAIDHDGDGFKDSTIVQLTKAGSVTLVGVLIQNATGLLADHDPTVS